MSSNKSKCVACFGVLRVPTKALSLDVVSLEWQEHKSSQGKTGSCCAADDYASLQSCLRANLPLTLHGLAEPRAGKCCP